MRRFLMQNCRSFNARPLENGHAEYVVGITLTLDWKLCPIVQFRAVAFGFARGLNGQTAIAPYHVENETDNPVI